MIKVIALANQKGGVGKKNRPTMVNYPYAMYQQALNLCDHTNSLVRETLKPRL